MKPLEPEGRGDHVYSFYTVAGVGLRLDEATGQAHVLWQFADGTFGLIEVPLYGTDEWPSVAQLPEDVSEVRSDETLDSLREEPIHDGRTGEVVPRVRARAGSKSEKEPSEL